MRASTMTLEQVRLTGLRALYRDLGPVGLVRFLQQFETGYGDYTAERHHWLGEPTVQELVQEIERERKTAPAEALWGTLKSEKSAEELRLEAYEDLGDCLDAKVPG